MPIDKEKELEVTEEFSNDDYYEYDDQDYGFIISPDGELKSIMFPEDLMENPPTEIKKILKIFGIKNINDLTPKTLH
jgi:hypothetical protein